MAEAFTFGCRLNIAESETMRTLAAGAGWPDALIVNTCIIPQGRGPARAMPIAAAVRDLASHHAEVVLTGVDLASHPELASLIRAVLREVPELPCLRLSSLDPAAMDEKFWRVFAEEERLMPHLHLSAQHGHDLILERMRRRHSRADLLQLAGRARALRPGLALGADLIAGFPTGTEEQLCALIDLVAEARLTFLHVSPCSARAGTPAARMPQLTMPLRRERSARLRAAGDVQRASRLASRLGRFEQVLMEADGVGHTAHFASLRVAGAVHGALLAARVTGHNGISLWAEAA